MYYYSDPLADAQARGRGSPALEASESSMEQQEQQPSVEHLEAPLTLLGQAKVSLGSVLCAMCARPWVSADQLQ